MTSQKNVVFNAEILEVDVQMSLTELCEACGVESAEITKLVEAGAIEPIDVSHIRWRFAGGNLQKARKAIRLQQDLGVNAAGAALALDLLDELERLRAELRRRID